MAALNKGFANERPKTEDWAFGQRTEQNATPPNIWKRRSLWLFGVVIVSAIGVGLFTYYQQELEEKRIKQEQWRENEDIYNEGWKCFDAKDFTEAEERFTRLIGLKHRESASYWARAVVRAGVGQDEAALEDYNQSIRLDGRNAGAFNNRGLILWRKGLLADAQGDFERAIELDPANKSAHQNLDAVSRAQRLNNGGDSGAVSGIERDRTASNLPTTKSDTGAGAEPVEVTRRLTETAFQAENRYKCKLPETNSFSACALIPADPKTAP